MTNPGIGVCSVFFNESLSVSLFRSTVGRPRCLGHSLVSDDPSGGQGAVLLVSTFIVGKLALVVRLGASGMAATLATPEWTHQRLSRQAGPSRMVERAGSVGTPLVVAPQVHIPRTGEPHCLLGGQAELAQPGSLEPIEPHWLLDVLAVVALDVSCLSFDLGTLLLPFDRQVAKHKG